jgi:ankyrin repeat protein
MILLRRWAKRGVRVTSSKSLCWAAANGKLDVVRLLLRELGANVNQSYDGCTALFAAAQVGHEHVVRCLAKEFGAYVNQANNGGATALHIAAQSGHGHVVRCLVKEFGADVNIATINGSTPVSDRLMLCKGQAAGD